MYFPVFGLNTGNTDQKKLRIWTLFTQCNPLFYHCFFFTISMKSKIRDWGMISLRHGFCLLNRNRVRIFLFTPILIKTTRNFKSIVQKALAICKRNVFFRFHNDSWNMLVNSSKDVLKYSWFKLGKHVFLLWNNVAKTCLYSLKFQGTLKSNISFILKHIFMYLTHFIQVAKCR